MTQPAPQSSTPVPHAGTPQTRLARDTLGDVAVPLHARFGASTQRAIDNFPISGQPFHPALIQALGLVKLAAASVNRDLGRFNSLPGGPLDPRAIAALIQAAREIADGQFADQFPVDIYQTGSGTSTNMNVNEVLAHRATEILGRDFRSQPLALHPNDHVNLGQSTNDIFPTAIHVAAALALKTQLRPALAELAEVLARHATDWDRIIKIGRTHLADATPIRLGQEVSGFARQLDLAAHRADRALQSLLELPVGGTAVGTGINTHPEFGRRVAAFLADETGIPFVEAVNHFEAAAQRDALVECHGLLRVIAVSLFEVANNIRWLASGPRCAFFEVHMPDLQPGSSIMPGKVNPVMSEALMQVAARVIGNDQTVAFAGATGGQFQLHALMPVIGQTSLESLSLLTRGVRAFTSRCARGLTANVEQCAASVERSLAMATALNPYIGYERAALLAKTAFATGRTIRELCREQQLLPDDQLDQILDPFQMTEPRG